jgi:hypothetical protein
LRVRDWLEKNEKKAAWPIRFIELPEQRVEDIVLPHKAILLAMWQNVRRQVSAYGTKHRLELRIPVVMEILASLGMPNPISVFYFRNMGLELFTLSKTFNRPEGATCRQHLRPPAACRMLMG